LCLVFHVMYWERASLSFRYKRKAAKLRAVFFFFLPFQAIMSFQNLVVSVIICCCCCCGVNYIFSYINEPMFYSRPCSLNSPKCALDLYMFNLTYLQDCQLLVLLNLWHNPSRVLEREDGSLHGQIQMIKQVKLRSNQVLILLFKKIQSTLVLF
jgi:hypothetical protein